MNGVLYDVALADMIVMNMMSMKELLRMWR